MLSKPGTDLDMANFPASIFCERFVRIAVRPALSGLCRCDHRMLAHLRVRGRVAVRRVVATARRAAFLTYTQMDPTSAHFHTLIALTAFGVFDGRDGFDMRASSAWH